MVIISFRVLLTASILQNRDNKNYITRKIIPVISQLQMKLAKIESNRRQY